MSIASSVMENVMPIMPLRSRQAGLGRAAISTHPRLRPVLKLQAGRFLDLNRQMPRIAANFGTQQRYLLAQLAAAMAFERRQTGLVTEHFLAAVLEHGIASRNTASSFMEEMLHYQLAHARPAGADRRSRPIMLAAQTIEALRFWLAVHLESLDAFDEGQRCAALRREPDLLAQVHPLVVRRIFASKATMQPSEIFALFSDMNDGGLLMDKIVSSLDETSAGTDRLSTFVRSFDHLSEPLRISRTHFLRKLAACERAGHAGWSGKRGASTFWISGAFLREYEAYQADKLANIDSAWQAVCEQG